MNEYYPDLMERIVRREPNAYLASLYWDSEMFGRSTAARKQNEKGIQEKDYKAALLELFSDMEGNFETSHKRYVAERYRKFLQPNGIIHLKTDSNFMFTYTKYMIGANCLPVEFMTEDLYHSDLVDDILSIKTYYEQQWLDRGLAIKYIKFRLPQEGQLQEPDVEIELDSYRSYNRSKRSGLSTSK